MEWVPNKEPSTSRPSVKEYKKIDGNATSHSMYAIKANAQKGVEKDVDLVSKNLKPKFLGQLHDEVLLTTGSRCKHFKENEDRIILKMAYCSGNTTEKLVASKTTKLFYQSN